MLYPRCFPGFRQVTNSHLLRRNIDAYLARMGKRSAFLDKPVADQSKRLVLGKDGCLIIEGAVSKMEDYSEFDLVAIWNQGQISTSKDGPSLVTEGEKPMHGAESLVDA